MLLILVVALSWMENLRDSELVSAAKSAVSYVTETTKTALKWGNDRLLEYGVDVGALNEKYGAQAVEMISSGWSQLMDACGVTDGTAMERLSGVFNAGVTGMQKMMDAFGLSQWKDYFGSVIVFVYDTGSSMLQQCGLNQVQIMDLLQKGGGTLMEQLFEFTGTSIRWLGNISVDDFVDTIKKNKETAMVYFQRLWNAEMANKILSMLTPSDETKMEAFGSIALKYAKEESDCDVCSKHLMWTLMSANKIDVIESLSYDVYRDLRYLKRQSDEDSYLQKTVVLFEHTCASDGPVNRKAMSVLKQLWNCCGRSPTLKFAVCRHHVSETEKFIIVAIRGSETKCDSNEFCSASELDSNEYRQMKNNVHTMARHRARIVYEEIRDILGDVTDEIYFTGFGYGGSVAAFACKLYRNEFKRDAKAVVFSAGNALTIEANNEYRDFVINVFSNERRVPGVSTSCRNNRRLIPPGCSFVNISNQLESISEYHWLYDANNKMFENPGDLIFSKSNTIGSLMNNESLFFGPIPVTKLATLRRRSNLDMTLWMKLNPNIISGLAVLAQDVYSQFKSPYKYVYTFEKQVRMITHWLDNFFVDAHTKVKANIYRNESTREIVVAVKGSSSPLDLIEFYICSDQKLTRNRNQKIANVNLHSLVEKRALVIYDNIVPIIELYEELGYQVYFTGHSYGGAVAPLLCLLYRHEHPNSNAKSIGFCSAPATVPDANPYFTDFSINILNHGDLVPYLSPNQTVAELIEDTNTSQLWKQSARFLTPVIDNIVKTDTRHLIPAGTSFMMGPPQPNTQGIPVSIMPPSMWQSSARNYTLLKSIRQHSIEDVTKYLTSDQHFVLQ